jgi:hypothetical protein
MRARISLLSALSFALWFVLSLASATNAHAITFTISPGSRALLVQIGSAGGSIDTVNFALTAAGVGDGTPVTGTPAILVNVAARDTRNRTVQLVADSSVPLSNGASTLSFTTISWTASDSDIPSGAFNGSAGQLIVQFRTNRQIYNFHTFRYANTQILQPGTYGGRVTYTISMP